MLGPMGRGDRTGTVVDVTTDGDRTLLRLRALTDLTGLATGRFSRPTVGASWERAAFAADIEFLGFSFTQFALPVVAGAALDFDFHPTPGLRSPRVVIPLLARTTDGVALLAPLDAFHEQVVAVTDDGLSWDGTATSTRCPPASPPRSASTRPTR